MIEKGSTEEQIDAIECFLMKYISDSKEIPGIIDACVSDIQTSSGCISIEELTVKYGASRRYLEKHFINVVGCSPGKYAKLMRFMHILKEIENNETQSNDLIAQYNFYDQSHFIKDFESFMGEKPAKYFEKRNALISEVFGKKDIS